MSWTVLSEHMLKNNSNLQTVKATNLLRWPIEPDSILGAYRSSKHRVKVQTVEIEKWWSKWKIKTNNWSYKFKSLVNFKYHRPPEVVV